MPRIIGKTKDGSEEITDLDHLVGLVEKTACIERFGSERTFTIRMPDMTAALIDAMAEHSGVTRNLLCVQMLEFASGEVFEHLSKKTKAAVNNARDGIVSKWVEEIEAAKGGA